MIQNLIKKAFGTANANEAASFLASACNRLKGVSRAEIQSEIEQALCGVNLNRLGSQDVSLMARLKAAEAQVMQLRAELTSAASKTNTKTVYQDNPETLRRLAQAQSELAALRLNTVSQAEVQRLNTRVHGLQKNLEHEREHHYQELALLRETLQRKMDEQFHQTPDGRVSLELTGRIGELQQALNTQKALHAAELTDLHETMQQDIDHQRVLRSALVKNGNALVETIKELQLQIAGLKQQLQDSGRESDSSRTAYEQALQAHQTYINVLKNDIAGLSQKGSVLEEQTVELRSVVQSGSLELHEREQTISRLQQRLDEMTEATRNDQAAYQNIEQELLALRALLEQERVDCQHNYSLCESLSRKLEAAEAELTDSKGAKGFMRWITEK